MRIFAKRAYLSDGWARDVSVTLHDGKIAKVEGAISCIAGDISVDTLLPAVSNLHSHTFQRVIAGMTEYRVQGRESFWTWRAQMYRYLDRLLPEQLGAIAELAFMEMMEAGYAAVGEFHYVHHASGGQKYDDVAELSARVMHAALQTGIGITHLPVLYSQGGIDGRELTGGQLRFGNSIDRFCQLVTRCREIAVNLPSDTEIGVAPHSLRAVSPTDLKALLAQSPDGPIHMHIAEQPQEVYEIKAYLGNRPVEWLLGNNDVSDRWCLIHATHMTSSESRKLAQSGAVVGLCPVTEANLGDGVFAGPDYLTPNGAFGVGTDSNINVSLSAELRMLEYSQRLIHQERNLMISEAGSVGENLYAKAAAGGAQALGRNAGKIAEGRLADLVAIDSDHPTLCALDDHQVLDGFVFASRDDVVTDVWSAGRHQVRNGRHIARDPIIERYKKTVADLMLA